MNEQEKIKFVMELCNAIKSEVIQDIQAGKVPESWNGIELRWLLAERANKASRFGDRARKREYDNTVIVNNL